jgi:5-deoxy-glucuronate isomerase
VLTVDGPSRTLCAPGADGTLGVTEVTGPARLTAAEVWAWVLVESGEGRLGTADVSGRSTVFDSAGWSALVAPGDSLDVGEGLRCTVFWRAREGAPDGGATRLIDPATVADEERGAGTTARRVRTYLPSGPFIAGETINPPGGWSSWPPHRHDVDADHESAHEEVYAYRFTPAEGFGVHVAYTRAGAEDAAPQVVRHGDLIRISEGYHPVVAAPGFTMGYVWALAGNRPEPTPAIDPTYQA